MRRLMAWAATLYPAAWRRRYGDEMHALIEETHPSARAVVDIARAAAAAQVASLTGGDPMTERLAPHAIRFAVAAAVLILPTAFLVAISLLKYVFGVPAPFDAVEPVASPIVLHPIGETFLILAPYVALLLAAVPVTRIRLGRHGGRLSGSLQVEAPFLNVVVVLASAALIVFMAAYWLVENL